MTTPTIAALSRKYGPIPCLFETNHISELYVNCPFIKILSEKPDCPPMFTSSKCRRRKSAESDAECIFRIYGEGGVMPDTYVDCDITKKINKNGNKAVALFHGCLGEFWRQKKNLPIKTIQNMVDIVKGSGFMPIILGNKSDWKHYWRHVDLSDCCNFVNQLTLKDSVSVLSQCDSFISNDTGLYHVAAALKVPGLVLWHQTSYRKNKAPWNGITHCLNKTADRKVYKLAIKKFVQEL